MIPIMVSKSKILFLIEAFFNMCWVFIWLFFFIHYGKLMNQYGKMDFHITYPIIYIAVECWALLSLLIIMLLIFKMIKDIKNYFNNK